MFKNALAFAGGKNWNQYNFLQHGNLFYEVYQFNNMQREIKDEAVTKQRANCSFNSNDQNPSISTKVQRLSTKIGIPPGSYILFY